MLPFSRSPAPSGVTARIDHWIDPARLPADVHALRRARIAVVGGWLALATYGLLGITLMLGRAPVLPIAEAILAIALTMGALARVRWGGRTQPAAWFLTLSLVLTPLSQGAVDLGIRDPALALIMLGPLAGALTSGARLAIVAAAVGTLAAITLFVLDALGAAATPYSGPAEIAAYALAMVVFCCVLTATTGILYVPHTRGQP